MNYKILSTNHCIGVNGGRFSSLYAVGDLSLAMVDTDASRKDVEFDSLHSYEAVGDGNSTMQGTLNRWNDVRSRMGYNRGYYTCEVGVED